MDIFMVLGLLVLPVTVLVGGRAILLNRRESREREARSRARWDRQQ